MNVVSRDLFQSLISDPAYEGGMAGSHGNFLHYFSFQQSEQGFQVCHTLNSICCFLFLDSGHPGGYEVGSGCGSICISTMISDTERLSTCSLAACVCSREGRLLELFTRSWTGALLLLSRCRGCFCAQDSNPWSDSWFVNSPHLLWAFYSLYRVL